MGVRCKWDCIKDKSRTFMFATVMDRLTHEVSQEFPWTMMFADETGICRESWEQVEICTRERRNEDQSIRLRSHHG